MRKDNQPKKHRASSKKIAAIGLPNPAPLFLVGTKRFELAAAPVLADQPDCTLLSLVSHEPVVGVFKPEGKLAWMLVPVTLLGSPGPPAPRSGSPPSSGRPGGRTDAFRSRLRKVGFASQ